MPSTLIGHHLHAGEDRVTCIDSSFILDSPPSQQRIEEEEQDEDEGAVGDTLDYSVP